MPSWQGVNDLLDTAAFDVDVWQIVFLEVQEDFAWYDDLQSLDLIVDEDVCRDFAWDVRSFQL